MTCGRCCRHGRLKRTSVGRSRSGSNPTCGHEPTEAPAYLKAGACSSASSSSARSRSAVAWHRQKPAIIA